MEILRITLLFLLVPILWAFVEEVFNIDIFKKDSKNSHRWADFEVFCGCSYIFLSMIYIIFK